MPVLLVLIHLRTNPTTRALAALFHTSQSAVDRLIHYLAPILVQARQPDPAGHAGSWIIDGTPIPVHDHTITAVSKNYRRSINTQILIGADSRRYVTVSRCWPGNRNDLVAARHTVAHPLTGHHKILGDGGYRGITTITTPGRDHTGRIIRVNRYRAHRQIRARVEHNIARLKDRRMDIPPNRGGMHYEE